MNDAHEMDTEDLVRPLEPAAAEEAATGPAPLDAPPDDESPREGPPTAPPPVDPPERAIEDLGARLSQRLDAIQALLEREARAEATRERVVDRLHAELQEYKQDLLLKVQRPIFIDLIQLHDDIGKMIEARPSGETDPDRTLAIRSLLESIQVAIEDILYRQGVEPFATQGEAFDPRRQRAVATISVEDPARNKTIAGRIRKGFEAGEKMIRPELVSVYTFRPPPPPDSPA